MVDRVRPVEGQVRDLRAQAAEGDAVAHGRGAIGEGSLDGEHQARTGDTVIDGGVGAIVEVLVEEVVGEMLGNDRVARKQNAPATFQLGSVQRIAELDCEAGGVLEPGREATDGRGIVDRTHTLEDRMGRGR